MIELEIEIVEQTHHIVNNSAPRCPFCHDAVTINSSKTACEACMAWHHKECWTEHGACSACGRGQTESLESESASNDHWPEVTQICRHPDCSDAAQSHLKVVRYQKLCLSHAKEKAEKAVKDSSRLSLAAGVFLFFLMIGIWLSDRQVDELAPALLTSLLCVLILGLSSTRGNQTNLKKLNEVKEKAGKDKEK